MACSPKRAARRPPASGALIAVVAAMLAASVAPAPALAAGPGYVGIQGEPLGAGAGLRILSVDPASPAAQLKVKPGDVLESARDSSALRVRLAPINNQADLDAFLTALPAGHQVQLNGDFGGRDFVFVKPTFGSATLSATAPAAPSVASVEATRTTYLDMCGRGAEKLSAATCEGLRRDLDAAATEQAAAARAAELMASWRQLCGPSAASGLSKETCEAMLAEAKR